MEQSAITVTLARRVAELEAQNERLAMQNYQLFLAMDNLLRPLEKRWKVTDMDVRIAEARAQLNKQRKGASHG